MDDRLTPKIENDDVVFERYSNRTLPQYKVTGALLTPYAGPWTDSQVLHLLKRTMFGATYRDLVFLRGLTVTETVDFLLNNIPDHPAPPVNDYSTFLDADLTGIPFGATWVDAYFGDGNLNASRIFSYKAWWYRQLCSQNISIQEKMVLFWHNHFATKAVTVEDARACYKHHTLLRTFALGNFRELTRNVTTDTCMLFFLNGYLNTKNSPDENYARELQELFTIGNPTGHYTEDDVKAAARVLTGWNATNVSQQSFFTPISHDTGDKVFSAYYDHTVITGKTGTAGATEKDALIDMIFNHPDVALHICRKLYRFFVYYNIDDTVEQTVIQPMADALIANNYEIKPVLALLLKSEHFYSTSAVGCHIKTPLDFMVGLYRALDVQLPGSYQLLDRFNLFSEQRLTAWRMGLDLHDPPNVAGWPAYYSIPAYYELWINSTTITQRLAYIDALLLTGINASGETVKADLPALVQQWTGAGDPNLLIKWAVGLFSGVSLSSAHLDALKRILLTGQSSDNYWTDAWTAYVADPTAEHSSIVESRLTSFFSALLKYAECQLC